MGCAPECRPTMASLSCAKMALLAQWMPFQSGPRWRSSLLRRRTSPRQRTEPSDRPKQAKMPHIFALCSVSSTETVHCRKNIDPICSAESQRLQQQVASDFQRVNKTASSALFFFFLSRSLVHSVHEFVPVWRNATLQKADEKKAEKYCRFGKKSIDIAVQIVYFQGSYMKCFFCGT